MTESLKLNDFSYDLKKILQNFHYPKSRLILLIDVFIEEDWKKLYKFAINNDYRFLSFGDSSLLFKK